MPNLLDNETVDRKLVFGQALFGWLKSPKNGLCEKVDCQCFVGGENSSRFPLFFYALAGETGGAYRNSCMRLP